MAGVDFQILVELDPLSSLSSLRVRELGELCQVERIKQDEDPFRGHGVAGQSVYLVKGMLALNYSDGNKMNISAGSEWARHPIGKRQATIASARALTDIELIRIDDDLLDIMVTWDLFSRPGAGGGLLAAPTLASVPERVLQSGMFSAANLKNGPFAQLPPANIEALLARIESVKVKSGDVVIREGDEGDYYYVVESGRALVSRVVGGVTVVLAELGGGEVFGEEALISGAKRNATVTMKSHGMLLRLDKKDFAELLQEPLLNQISLEEAKQKVAAGAVWLDVRYPSEYRHDKLAGAINVPLNEIRSAVGVLDKGKEYMVYCQSGRRSSAAAFILAQRGYKISVLRGGLEGGGNS